MAVSLSPALDPGSGGSSCLESLHLQDPLLAEEDEQLPFPRHVVSAFQELDIIEDLISVMFVRTQEIIVSDPESQIIVGSIDVIKTIRFPIRSLIGPVQAFDDLFERTIPAGDSIVIGESDDLGDPEREVFPKLFGEFHGGKWIGTVTVRNESKMSRESFQTAECHAHGKDAGTDTAVIGYSVADDGAGGGIDDEPDISFGAADLDIGLIGDEVLSFPVRILVDKRLDTDGGSLAVVGDLLVGDMDVI